MVSGYKLLVFPVKDLAAAKALYTEMLGVEPYADSPYYVGFKVSDQEIGLDPNGHAKGMTAPLNYLQVGDVKASLAAYLAAGAEQVQGVTDVGGGKIIATVKDADGNIIGLI